MSAFPPRGEPLPQMALDVPIYAHHPKTLHGSDDENDQTCRKIDAIKRKAIDGEVFFTQDAVDG